MEVRMLHYIGEGTKFMQGITEYIHSIELDDTTDREDFGCPGFTFHCEYTADVPDCFPVDRSLHIDARS